MPSGMEWWRSTLCHPLCLVDECLGWLSVFAPNTEDVLVCGPGALVASSGAQRLPRYQNPLGLDHPGTLLQPQGMIILRAGTFLMKYLKEQEGCVIPVFRYSRWAFGATGPDGRMQEPNLLQPAQGVCREPWQNLFSVSSQGKLSIVLHFGAKAGRVKTLPIKVYITTPLFLPQASAETSAKITPVV